MRSWFIGQHMLAHYYTIFDATGLDREPRTLRVGVAPANPIDLIGHDLL